MGRCQWGRGLISPEGGDGCDRQEWTGELFIKKPNLSAEKDVRAGVLSPVYGFLGLLSNRARRRTAKCFAPTRPHREVNLSLHFVALG